MANHDPLIYWAAVPSREIADNILDKCDAYYKYLQSSGRLDMYRRSWLYYYRPRMTGGILNFVGEQGELTQFSVNQYRNLLVHIENIVTQQRLQYEPRATNSDTKSQAQVILGANLVDYYMKVQRFERNIKQSVKFATQYGEGFVREDWDAQGGKVYGMTPMGTPSFQGDAKMKPYAPIDVVRDFTKNSAGLNDWFICRDFENKFDLAAKYPDLAKEILEDSIDIMLLAKSTTVNSIALEQSDNIPTYTLIHPVTPAMPKGRYTVVLDNGTVLLDGPLPYRRPHIYRLAPDEESGTIFGFTVAYDLLCVQAALDILYSTVITNQSTFGVQNILVPKGHDLSVSQLAGNLNLCEYDPKLGEPKALQLCSTPPEIFNFIQHLEGLGETMAGINSVVRGNPEASLKSGAALALVQAQAIQFSMSFQQSYVQFNEDIGTGLIQLLQDFASVPRIAAIVGKSNRPLLKEFTGSDLDSIDRVTVDVGNPMTNTTAGKVNMADQMLQYNMIENPDQYVQVVTTGRLEPVIQSKQSELLLIKSENESLSEGQPVRALITDKHDQHILEHRVVLASPEARANPNSPQVQSTLAHIQEHIQFLKTADPILLQLIGQQTMMPPMQPQPTPQDGGTGEMLDPAAAQPDMPNMPNAPQGTEPGTAAVIEQQGQLAAQAQPAMA